MKLQRTAIAAALSLLPLGQPLLLGTVGITTATTAVVLQQTPAVAQVSSAVAKVAKAITVRIEGATQGSGVLVKKEGNRYTVLTAWHVVEGNRPGEELAIFTPDGKEHQLEQGSIQRLGEVDMAVLTFSSGGAYEVASIGDIKKVKYDDPIYVAGFPLNNSQNLRYEPGEVVANAEVGIDQGYQLLYDNKTESGMSGGVLLNADGELVGLHGRGERNEQSSTGTEIAIKTGVNQGVPITYYNLFASGAPVVVSKTTATTADDYLAQARGSSLKKGREKSVIRLAEQSLKLRESAEGYFLVGTNKHNLGDNQGAIADFNKAIEIDPQLAGPYYNRGVLKGELEDYQGAFDDYNKAIEIDPQHFEFYNNRGVAKSNLKDYQGAITDYNKAIAINPQLAEAYSNRCTAKSDLGDYQGAIADCNKAIVINPQDSFAYYNLGNAKVKSGDYQGAIADYSKAIAIDPQYFIAYTNRGYPKEQLGDYQGAIADYNKAIAINPQYVNAYSSRGLAKIDLGDYQRAIADCNKAIAINPQYAFAYTTRGIAKGLSGDKQAEIADFNKAIAINPQYANAYVGRGLAKGRSGDQQGMCLDFRKGSSLGNQIATKGLNQICQ
ncbi:tetratricopeptide repeat protein [Prochlorococcus sp. MIT 0701]|uniref:tetratricopeptide repeat protein n=1 Tax=Prochlorococcus sp. MIT 0701 TaxID=1499502 RepID=UPI0039B02341